jgi:membrane peptidoglycan carboxypeptidase
MTRTRQRRAKRKARRTVTNAYGVAAATRGALRLGNLEWTVRSSPQRLAQRRRLPIRKMRRALFPVFASGVICLMIFSGLLMMVPSVGNAPVLARSVDEAHHAAYPGPAVPRRFSAALAATLDRTFYSRAELLQVPGMFFGGLIHPSSQSGQTIFQRLAATLYLRGSTGMAAGIERSILGIKLELTYSRAEVMRLYAAVTYFGHGYYGLSAASCGYFGTQPAQLTWAQAAMIAAIAAAPSTNDPYSHAASARAAELAILRRLVSAKVLSKPDAASAYREPLHLRGADRAHHRRHHGHHARKSPPDCTVSHK